MRFATDENFDGRILRGLLNCLPKLDVAANGWIFGARTFMLTNN